MQKSLYGALILSALIVGVGSSNVNAQEPIAQTLPNLEANGFVKSGIKGYKLVPGPKVAFVDWNFGPGVNFTFPLPKKGDGPAVAPTVVVVNGNEADPLNVNSPGVFISPTTTQGVLRIHWVPVMMNPKADGPGFGFSSQRSIIDELGGENTSLIVPRTLAGDYITSASGYPLVSFLTAADRTAFLKTEVWTTIVKERTKAVKADPKKNAPEGTVVEEKKDDPKPKAKDGEKKDDKDVPPAKKE